MTLQFIHAYAIELEGSVSSKRPHLRGPGSRQHSEHRAARAQVHHQAGHVDGEGSPYRRNLRTTAGVSDTSGIT